MTCSQCGTINPQGTLFCNICFSPLNTGQNSNSLSGSGNISQSNPLQGNRGNTGKKAIKMGTPGAMINKPRLIIIENTQPTGQSIDFPTPPYKSDITIGRTDLKNSIVVDIDVNLYNGFDKGVSRKHARISYSNNNFFIEDWDSKLGTFVNKEKLHKGVQKIFQEGDEIRFANLITRFEV